MVIRLNFVSGVPAYLQIVEQVKVIAASGAYRPGEALPTIRALAEQVRLNRNTIAKAYSELEHQGIIETVTGRGCFLANTKSPLRAEAKRELLARDIDTAIVQAHHLQVPRAQFLGLVHQRLDEFEKRKNVAARLEPRSS